MTPIYLIAEIHPHPDKLIEAREAYENLIAQTLQEPGCLLYDLVIEQNGHHWIMLEKWASKEAWHLHMETDHVKRIQDLNSSITSKETVLRFLDPLTQGVKS